MSSTKPKKNKGSKRKILIDEKTQNDPTIKVTRVAKAPKVAKLPPKSGNDELRMKANHETVEQHISVLKDSILYVETSESD